MDLSYLLTEYVQREPFRAECRMKQYHLKADIIYDGTHLEAELYDEDTGDRYIPFEVKGMSCAAGEELRNILDSFFRESDVFHSLIGYVEREYGFAPIIQFPDRYPQFRSFKNEKGKWFCLFMDVEYRKLGIEREGKAAILNLKLDPEKIAELIDGKQYFPAWHMNKKYWMTVLLDTNTELNTVYELIHDSYVLTGGLTKD